MNRKLKVESGKLNVHKSDKSDRSDKSDKCISKSSQINIIPKPHNVKDLSDLSDLSYLSDFKQKAAFTLSEVLITLAVIGVVAAMTLPIVINKINDHNFKVAYKKAYRDVNEAYRMMKATDDEFEEIVCSNANCSSRAFGRNFELLAKQFKATKTCFRSNKYKCLKCSGNYSAHECYTNDASAFIDNSGRVWAMYFDAEAYFYVDTNGDKGPNLTGKDRWGFLLPYPRDSRTNKNFIVPYYDKDITTKSNTCTSGDCKYKSWLIE